MLSRRGSPGLDPDQIKTLEKQHPGAQFRRAQLRSRLRVVVPGTCRSRRPGHCRPGRAVPAIEPPAFPSFSPLLQRSASWPSRSELLLHRQANSKCRSFSKFAFYVDCSVMVIDYAPGNRKSKPGALLPFCRIKRLEYPGQIVIGDSLPRIGYFYLYVILMPGFIHRLPSLPGASWIGAALEHSMRQHFEMAHG